MAIVPFQAFADSSCGGIVERHVQCAQSPMHLIMPPLLGGGIKQWCGLTSVWRLTTSVAYREYSWRPQLLEARRAGRRWPGVRRVWAGAGPQRAAYRGAYRGGLPPTACWICRSVWHQLVALFDEVWEQKLIITVCNNIKTNITSQWRHCRVKLVLNFVERREIVNSELNAQNTSGSCI